MARKKDLWSIYRVMITIGDGIWPLSYGSFGPQGRAATSHQPASGPAPYILKALRMLRTLRYLKITTGCYKATQISSV